MDRELQQRLLRHAYRLALRSKDPSTQNGAVLVEVDGRSFADGWNGLPDGVLDRPERWERPLKYKVVEHAERACIYNALHQPVPASRGTLVCPWMACPDCARAIIAVGIRKCVTHRQAHEKTPKHWAGEIAVAFEMFGEAGVEVVFYDGKIHTAEPVLMNGEYWNP